MHTGHDTRRFMGIGITRQLGGGVTFLDGRPFLNAPSFLFLRGLDTRVFCSFEERFLVKLIFFYLACVSSLFLLSHLI